MATLASPNYALLTSEWESPGTCAPREGAAQIVHFTADDGRLLTGSLYTPNSRPRAGILIAGATGVPRGFYNRYAVWLATQGYVVLSFDYRGIGDSRLHSMRADPARMREWGQLDLPAAVDCLHEQIGDLPMLMIGHSVGGQMLGVMRNHRRIAACAMIATGIGYWGGMPRGFGWFTLAMWYGFEPVTGWLMGYVPNSRIGFGEDLPRGVARDWRNWCLRADYFSELRHDDPPADFEGVRCPLLTLHFPDDPIATDANVRGLLRFYPNAPTEKRLLQPSDYGQRNIGHLHFFASRMPEALWRVPLDWLEAQIA